MPTAAWLAATVLLAAQPSGELRGAGQDSVLLPHCIVTAIDQVELPAQMPGVLIEVTAKKGMLVRKDQILGRIDDTMANVRLKSAKAKLDVAHEKAVNDSEVRASKKVAELYRLEYEDSVAINDRTPKAVPETQLRRQKVQWEKGTLDAEVEQMKFQVAKLEEKVAGVEVENVETELKQRQIKAPFDGVVVELLRQQSEWVREGDPLLRVVRMDRLRVEGFLVAREYAPGRVDGAAVSVRVKVAGGEPQLVKAAVDFVSPLVEVTGDYRISAEIDNRPGGGGYAWLVRPGADVEMTIQLKNAGASVPRVLREQ